MGIKKIISNTISRIALKLLPNRAAKVGLIVKSSKKKEKEERGFGLGALVIVISTYTEFTDHSGRKVRRPVNLDFAQITKKITFLEGQEEGTLVEAQVWNIPEPLFLGDINLLGEHCYDIGIAPTFDDINDLRDHRMLMRLDSNGPPHSKHTHSHFVWEKGVEITITADRVRRATYTDLMKLILAR